MCTSAGIPNNSLRPGGSRPEVPKGRGPVATGKAQRNPWQKLERNHSPRRGGGCAASVENIFFLKRNFVCAKELQQFLAEGLYPMMFFLPLNVIPNGTHLGLADGENTISLLPTEHLHGWKCFMNPSGRVGLEIPDESCDRFIGAPPEQNVDVISNPADLKDDSTLSADDSTEVIVDAGTNLFREPRFPMFGAEYEVKFKIMECSRHGRRIIRRPFRAESKKFSSPVHGFRCASPVATSPRSFGAVSWRNHDVFEDCLSVELLS